MKKIMILVVLGITFILVGCEKEEIPEVFTLELIGEETIEIQEGTEYFDIGVLLNSEETHEVSYLSNVRTDKVGTYYVKYQYGEVSLTRTIVVVAGPRTDFLELVELFNQSDNFEYKMRLDVEYTKYGFDHQFFQSKEYEVDGLLSYGNLSGNNINSEDDYHQLQYLLKNLENSVTERYIDTGSGFFYVEEGLYVKHSSNVTDFKLDEFTYITREVVDGIDEYLVYLTFQGYLGGFYNKTNFFNDSDFFTHEVNEPLEVLVKAKDGLIISITVDLTNVIETANKQQGILEVTKYIYEYDFARYNEVSLTLPETALTARESSKSE